jgi:hypothetical protein
MAKIDQSKIAVLSSGDETRHRRLSHARVSRLRSTGQCFLFIPDPATLSASVAFISTLHEIQI